MSSLNHQLMNQQFPLSPFVDNSENFAVHFSSIDFVCNKENCSTFVVSQVFCFFGFHSSRQVAAPPKGEILKCLHNEFVVSFTKRVSFTWLILLIDFSLFTVWHNTWDYDTTAAQLILIEYNIINCYNRVRNLYVWVLHYLCFAAWPFYTARNLGFVFFTDCRRHWFSYHSCITPHRVK